MPKSSEIRATLCAFANSTLPGQFAVLFLGIEDDGTICGLGDANLDALQREIVRIGKEECYPEVRPIPQVVAFEGKTVLAVIVECSKERPHFTGQAFVRRGPSNVKASKEKFDELVLERIDRVARLLREKNNGRVVRVRWNNPPVARQEVIERYMVFNHPAYRVEDCDAFVLRLFNTANHDNVSVPIDRVTINYSDTDHVTLLEIDSIYPHFKMDLPRVGPLSRALGIAEPRTGGS